MNKSRRKRIADSLSILQSSREQIKNAIEEEKLALSKVPDDDDNEEKRDAMDEIISGLEDALSSLDEAIEALEGADFWKKR